jgi:hypothetical protein
LSFKRKAAGVVVMSGPAATRLRSIGTGERLIHLST